MTSFPNLDLLMGGYFHQDWPEESATFADVVSRFTHQEAPDVVRGLLAEVDDLLGSGRTEAELLATLEGAGGAFDPRSEGDSVARWLEGVREQVRATSR